MGQAGVCWDNAMAESLWATLTTEYYYRRTFTTRDQVYTGVATWIEDLCNRRRIHTSLGGKSPIEYELHQAAWTTAPPTNRQQLPHRPNLQPPTNTRSPTLNSDDPHFQGADYTERAITRLAYMVLVRFRPTPQRQCRQTILLASVAWKGVVVAS